MTEGPGGDEGQCPGCGWPVRADDNFCEACRADLRAAADAGLTPIPQQSGGHTAAEDLDDPVPRDPVQEGAGHAAVSGGGDGPAGACPFCRSSSAGTDGYCESCGRRLPSGDDHSELVLSLLAGVTDRGLRHARNEDAVALATADLAAGPVAVAAVFDGVSGSPRPQEASQAAARALVRVAVDRLLAGAQPGAALADAVDSAREAVTALAVSDTEAPAATFVGAVLTSDEVTLAWLGDSRCYWLGYGPQACARRLTSDDSVAAEMVAAGLVSEDESLALPQAHVVTKWIGADLGETPPHVTSFEPPGPGVVLLCSDGLWNYQPDADGLARMALPGALADPLGAAGALVRFALESGGMDNVSVVLVPYPLRESAGPQAPARSGVSATVSDR